MSKLSAIDTGERDRALGDLEKVRGELRDLQLRHTELQVWLKLQQEKIDRLEGDNKRFRERGGGMGDQKVIVQEVGTGRIQQVHTVLVSIYFINNELFTGAICGEASVGYQADHHKPAELSRNLGGD